MLKNSILNMKRGLNHLFLATKDGDVLKCALLVTFRLVYIRGTPEQNEVALNAIVSRVGGRPFEDEHGSNLSSLLLPFMAVPYALACSESQIFDTAFTREISGSGSDQYYQCNLNQAMPI